MKRLIFLICILIILNLFIIPSFCSDLDFLDIKGHWSENSVKILSEKGVISGRGDGLFHPEEQVLINEYIKMVVTALGYTDIENYPGDWAKNYIEKAKELGLVFDREITDYYEYEPINRGMMAKIAIRALKDEAVPDYIYAYKGLITDYNDLDANIRLDALKCIEKGIIKGMPDGAFRSDNYSTRAEAATVIHRMISQEEREKAKSIFADPDPEFEAFMASPEAKEYCSIDYIHKAVDGKIIWGGPYQEYTGEVLLQTWHNPEANKEAYELLRNIIMYAKENNHYVRVFLSTDSSALIVSYYENKLYGELNPDTYGTNWYLSLKLVPNKFNEAQEKYTYYTWAVSSLIKDTTEDRKAVNYKEPDMLKSLEIGIKSIYGSELGEKLFDYTIGEYDTERFYLDNNLGDYKNKHIGIYEELGGLEISNSNEAESVLVRFSTNKK
jgi:hypothetical protein